MTLWALCGPSSLPRPGLCRLENEMTRGDPGLRKGREHVCLCFTAVVGCSIPAPYIEAGTGQVTK